jgi:hypothetical protein
VGAHCENVTAFVDAPKVAKKEGRVWDAEFLEVAMESPFYF